MEVQEGLFIGKLIDMYDKSEEYNEERDAEEEPEVEKKCDTRRGYEKFQSIAEIKQAVAADLRRAATRLRKSSSTRSLRSSNSRRGSSRRGLCRRTAALEDEKEHASGGCGYGVERCAEPEVQEGKPEESKEQDAQEEAAVQRRVLMSSSTEQEITRAAGGGFTRRFLACVGLRQAARQ